MTSSTQHRPARSGLTRVADVDLIMDVTSTSPPTNPVQLPVQLPVRLPVQRRKGDVEPGLEQGEPQAAPIRRDRAALRAPVRTTTDRTAPRTSRPALRGRTPMRDRTVLRDRAALRGRAAGRASRTTITEGPGTAAVRHHHEPRARRRRGLVRVAALLVLAVIATVLWGGYQVRSAQSSLTAARGETQVVQRQLASYSWAGAGAGLARARLHAEAAENVSQGRYWRLAEQLPYVGDDVTAIGRAADTMNALAQATRPLESALPRIGALGEDDDPEPDRPGQIDVAALQTVADTLPAVDSALAAGIAALQDIPSTGLLGSVGTGLASTHRVVDSLGSMSSSAAPVLGLLPQMLGASGEQTWLVLLEQPASGDPVTGEAAQADPGRVAAYSVVKASAGTLTVVAAGRRPAATTAAGLATTIGRLAVHPDYVLVLDASALATLVQATGPIQLGTRTIDGASTERFLDHDVLGLGRSTTWTDKVAAMVLRRSLTKLASGTVDGPQLIRSLAAPIDDRRLQLWAADGKVQPLLLELSVAAGPDAGEAGALARLVTGTGTGTGTG